MSAELLQTLKLVVSRVVMRGAQIIAFLIMARGLSPEGFGAYAVITSAIFLASQIGNLGLRQAAAYMIGRKILSDGEVAPTLVVLWPILAALTFALVWCVNRDAITQLGDGAVVVVAVTIAASLLITLLQGIFLGRAEFGSFGVTESSQRVILMLFAIALAITGSISLPTAMWALALSFLLIIPYTIWRVWRGMSGIKLRIDIAPAMVRYGILFALSMFLVMLNTRAGLFIVEDRFGAEVAGRFFAGQRINEIFLEFATMVSLVLFSKMAREGGGRQPMEEAVSVSAWMFWSFIGVAFVVTFFAQPAIRILLGSAYMGSAPVVQILAFGLAPAAVVKVMNGVIAGSGRPYLSAAVVGGGIVINVLVTFALMASAGELAAAYGLVAGSVVSMACYILIAKVWYGISLLQCFRINLSEIAAITVKMKRLLKRPAAGGK